jgi:hypothetical protein
MAMTISGGPRVHCPIAAKVRPIQPIKHLSCEATRKCALAVFRYRSKRSVWLAYARLEIGMGTLKGKTRMARNKGRSSDEAEMGTMIPTSTEWLILGRMEKQVP